MTEEKKKEWKLRQIEREMRILYEMLKQINQRLKNLEEERADRAQ